MSQSHRIEFCLVPRLKWKIVPPPAVIPPKPARIIRYANYRQRVGMYPRTSIMIIAPSIGAVLGTLLIYEFLAKPGRERMRTFFFEVCGTDEPDSEFLRQWSANQPPFPETKEEYEDMCQWSHDKLWPECPLVPYDVPGWDRNKLKGKDLRTLQKELVSPLDINFIYPH